jgi:glycosyltransferase involved in cell wall biosynthesis
MFKLLPYMAFIQARILTLFSIRRARKIVHLSEKRVLNNQNRTRQLLLDVSIIVQNDAGTGIQRVVREIWQHLNHLSKNNENYILRPVYVTRKKTFRYLSGDKPVASDLIVTVNADDVFLGVDWTANLLTSHANTLLQWKKKGVILNFVLYDMLPILNPHWFTKQTQIKFKRWLRTVVIYADNIFCISEAVKVDLNNWLFELNLDGCEKPNIKILPLGGDFNKQIIHQIRPEEKQVLERIISKPYVLMVGTIEPRKGHQQVVEAFKLLWETRKDVSLVLVGKPGWGTKSLQTDLSLLRENRLDFFWLDNASDGCLECLYQGALGVVVASQGEGYGLPVIEALHYQKKVLVRDLPVFREIAGNSVTYFEGSTVKNLLDAITNWLIEDPKTNTVVNKSWSAATQSLIFNLGL